MKVCHVINTLNRGGAETHLFDLVHQQTLKSYEVELVVIGSDRENIMSLEEEFKNLQIRIKRLNGPRMFNISSYFRLYSHIKEINTRLSTLTNLEVTLCYTSFANLILLLDG